MKKYPHILPSLVYIAFLVALIWGWTLNIIALVSSHAFMAVTEFVLRIVGVFIPFLGTIMGFFV